MTELPQSAVQLRRMLSLPMMSLYGNATTVGTGSRTFTVLKGDGLIDLPSTQHVVLPDLRAVEAAASAD